MSWVYDDRNQLLLLRFENTTIPIDIIDIADAVNEGMGGGLTLGYIISKNGDTLNIYIDVSTKDGKKRFNTTTRVPLSLGIDIEKEIERRKRRVVRIAKQNLEDFCRCIVDRLSKGIAIISCDECWIDLDVPQDVCHDEFCNEILNVMYARRSAEVTVKAVEMLDRRLRRYGLSMSIWSTSPGCYVFTILPSELSDMAPEIAFQDEQNLVNNLYRSNVHVVTLTLLMVKLGIEELDLVQAIPKIALKISEILSKEFRLRTCTPIVDRVPTP